MGQKTPEDHTWYMDKLGNFDEQIQFDIVSDLCELFEFR